MKKFLVLGAFLIFFARVASAQETKESTLTPRQLLLLQVPEDFVLTSDDGSATWEVTHESGEPLEAITIVIVPEVTILLALGRELRAYAHFLFMPPAIELTLDGRVGENEALDKAETETAMKILKAFNILTDDQLAEFIKKNFSGKKAAVAL